MDSGGRIRTCDLRVMSVSSRAFGRSTKRIRPPRYFRDELFAVSCNRSRLLRDIRGTRLCGFGSAVQPPGGTEKADR